MAVLLVKKPEKPRVRLRTGWYHSSYDKAKIGGQKKMAWWYLAAAIFCEVVATHALKATQGMGKWGAVSLVVLGYGAAFYFLSLALRQLPLALAYAVWCGAGIVLVAMVAWWWYGEALSAQGILGIGLICTGIAVLKCASVS
ncbi:DMT family transporter [Rubritalea tangerina]|uniref:DMT family transporter n=1 Tax=Rubritalea tangerina TaxID=430798 RepID=A0ABW4ZDY4_9BACT